MDTQSDKNIQKCDPKRLVPFVEIGGDILGGCLVAEARNFGEKWSVAVARDSPASFMSISIVIFDDTFAKYEWLCEPVSFSSC